MATTTQNPVFTCIGRSFGAPCEPATREEWEALRNEEWLRQTCERIEKGEEGLKQRLSVWTPHCAGFANNHRSIADAQKPLSRLMLDFDQKGHTDEIVAKLEAESELLKIRGLEVLFIEESVRRGTHVLVSVPEGMTAEEVQQIMQQLTGFEPDKAVKDVSRCIYMVPADHTRFVSDKMFMADTTPTVQETGAANRPAASEATRNEASELAEENPSESETPCFKGIPYSLIINEWWQLNGGVPQEGERNVKLHQLAVNLRAICDNRKEVLMQVMPRFGLSEAELHSIVDSACKEEPKGISKLMKQVVDSLSEGAGADEWGDEEEANALTINVRNLPIGLKESLSGVPESMHLPVLCGIMPLAAAYADQVEVDYCDGARQRLGLMTIVTGEQASGKSVVKHVVDVWKRQFDEEDSLARQKEDEWKEQKKCRKANEKAPEDPHVLIRQVPITVSCSTLLKRMKNACGRTLFSFGEELDTLRKTNGAGSWSSKYDIYRLGFDNGEWGQDYNSDQAESGVVKVAYNWTMLGTNGSLNKCFAGENVENGLSSRILIASMPDSSFQKMPKYGKRSAEDEAQIQEAVNRLRNASGVLDTPRLRKTMERWVEEKRIEAVKDIDHVKDTYRKRAAVIGFRCGVIFMLLAGKETKTCLDFAVMMADYCLRQQMRTFGSKLKEQLKSNAQTPCKRTGKNTSVFEQLPPVFSREELQALKNDCSDSGNRNVIMRWKADGWIERIDRDHFRKTSHCPIVPSSH